MTVFDEIARDLGKLNLDRVYRKSIRKNNEQLEERNRKNLLRGKLSTNKPIRPKYSPFTAKKKGFTTPNLFEKGDFQGKIKAVVSNSGDIVYDSSDEKAKYLEAKYSSGIYGANESDQTFIAQNIVKPEVINELLKIFR